MDDLKDFQASLRVSSPSWRSKPHKLGPKVKYFKLHHRPLLDDGDFRAGGGWLPIKIEVFRGSVFILCPVNRLNNVPKSFPLRVQADFLVANNLVNNTALLTYSGIIYSWAQETL